MSFKKLEKNLKQCLGIQTLKEEDTTHDEGLTEILETNYQDISKNIDLLINKADKLNRKMTILEFEKTIPINRDDAYFGSVTGPDDEPIDIRLRIINEKNKPVSRIDTRVNIINSLKIHLSLISYFNGSNRCVEGFINDIQFVLNLLSANERSLFIKLVYTYKITGDAKTLLDEFLTSSIEDFFQLLRSCYRDTNTFLGYKMIRKRCIQEVDSVLTYNKKFLRAELNVINAILNNTNLTLSQKEAYVSIETRNSLQEYIAGLNYDLRILIQIYGPGCLHEAQKIALDLEAKQQNVL